MVRTKKTVNFKGLMGDIECVIDYPKGDAKGWALVLHPHSLEGGTRDNKVVTTISRACVNDGLISVRPNFRGVGASAGEFDHGVGETADMLELVKQFYEMHPELINSYWFIGGFSFGTSVAAQVYSKLAAEEQKVPDSIFLAGPAIKRFKFMDINLPQDAFLVHGETDNVVPLSETMEYAREVDLPVVVIPNAGHFFHGKLLMLRMLVEQRLSIGMHSA